MSPLLRHLLAIAILPFSVAVLVPLWIAERYGVVPAFGRPAGQVALQLLGATLAGVGVLLFLSSLRRFATEGRGTLAPWDPPRALVVRGPYRFVRNPMISGVVFVLFGEALLLRSPPHGLWAGAFLVLNLVYIPLVEEPQLERRFGDAYREYRRHVGRLVPRLRPWRPGQDRIEIVPFEPRFQRDVVELIVGIQRGEFGIPITAEQQPDLRRIPEYYQTGRGDFWVALVGERVVGTIALLDIGAARGALRKLFVHPRYRGAQAGTARLLLDTLLRRANAHGVRELFLGTTSQFAAAHRFYEKHGFTEISRQQLPAGFPMLEVDVKFYRRELEAPRIVRTEAVRTARIHLRVPRAEIRNVMGPGLSELKAAVAAQGIAATGPWLTHHLRMDPDVFDFEICVPVAAPISAVGRVESGELPEATVARAIHRGSCENLAAAWAELDAWIAANGHEPGPDFWECYVVGPETSPDPGSWRTELNRPLIAS